jgi:hypothetical protein
LPFKGIKKVMKMNNEKNEKQRKDEEKAAEEMFKKVKLFGG